MYVCKRTFDPKGGTLRWLSHTGKHIEMEVSSKSLCQSNGGRTLTLPQWSGRHTSHNHIPVRA